MELMHSRAPLLRARGHLGELHRVGRDVLLDQEELISLPPQPLDQVCVAGRVVGQVNELGFVRLAPSFRLVGQFSMHKGNHDLQGTDAVRAHVLPGVACGRLGHFFFAANSAIFSSSGAVALLTPSAIAAAMVASRVSWSSIERSCSLWRRALSWRSDQAAIDSGAFAPAGAATGGESVLPGKIGFFGCRSSHSASRKVMHAGLSHANDGPLWVCSFDPSHCETMIMDVPSCKVHSVLCAVMPP